MHDNPIDADDFNIGGLNVGRVFPRIWAGSDSALPSADSLSAAVPEPATLMRAVAGFVCLFSRMPRLGGVALAPKPINQ